MKFAPLSNSFMLTSIIGLIISIFYVFPRWPDWGFTFILLFFSFILATLLSVTYSDTTAMLKIEPKQERETFYGKNFMEMTSIVTAKKKKPATRKKVAKPKKKAVAKKTKAKNSNRHATKRHR